MMVPGRDVRELGVREYALCSSGRAWHFIRNLHSHTLPIVGRCCPCLHAALRHRSGEIGLLFTRMAFLDDDVEEGRSTGKQVGQFTAAAFGVH